MSTTATGLRQQILSAQTEEEVVALVKQGATYEHASPKTKQSWRLASTRTLASHRGVKVEAKQAVEEPVEAPKKKKAKKKI
jgi:hypothetical protein